jgi:hypothetical protein
LSCDRGTGSPCDTVGSVTPARACALLMLASACVASSNPRPMPPLPARAVMPSKISIQLASAPAGVTGETSSRIGAADLARARDVLSTARNELAPHHWKLLDGKLTEAERAFERFNRIASASGRAAEIARGARGVAPAGRGAGTGEGIGTVRPAGPWLVLLLLLWPAETAGPEHDHAPEWLGAQLEFEDRLREVVRAARQVQAEIDAARRRPAKETPGRRQLPEPVADPERNDDLDEPFDDVPDGHNSDVPEWKRRCINRLTRCLNFNWTGDCEACMRWCEGQHRWPSNICRPRTPR